MARLPRLVVPGLPHHVIQRGNDRQSIFRDDVDRRRYLEDSPGSDAYAITLAVHAYVLMDNHVHMLVSPATAEGLSKTMQSLGRRYVGWFNARHGAQRYALGGALSLRRDRDGALSSCLHALHRAEPGTRRHGCASRRLCVVQRALSPGAAAGPARNRPPSFLGAREYAVRARGCVAVNARSRLARRTRSRKFPNRHSRAGHAAATHFWAWLKNRTERPVAPRPRGRPVTG